MNALVTITSKRQVTFPKELLEAMGLDKGDRMVAKVAKKKVVLEPAGRGILDFAGKLGKLKVPRGKTVDDLINEANMHYAAKDIR